MTELNYFILHETMDDNNINGDDGDDDNDNDNNHNDGLNNNNKTKNDTDINNNNNNNNRNLYIAPSSFRARMSKALQISVDVK